jgi:nucleoside-diphosphate-sugar epimerase
MLNKNVRVIVTGSTSKIGNQLIRKFALADIEVFALGGRKSSIWTLGQGIPKNIQADFLVHLAHDRKVSIEKNIEFTKLLCDSFQGRKIFISSTSAHLNAESKYGKSKFEMERIFIKNNGVVLRAGLIYGEHVGGMFEKLEKLIEKYSIYPLPHGSKNPLYTTHIDDLFCEIIRNMKRFTPGMQLAASKFPTSLHDLVGLLAEANNKKYIRLCLPRYPINSIIKFISKILPKISIFDSFISISNPVDKHEIKYLLEPKCTHRNFRITN